MSGEVAVELMGNVGADPELRFTSAGDPVASFPVAVTPRKKQGSEWVDEETQWYRVSAWRYDAEAVTEHVTKGARVRVCGKLRPSLYEGANGTRLSLDVTADWNGVTLVPRAAPQQQQRKPEPDPWS